jgi:hypothetical protein
MCIFSNNAGATVVILFTASATGAVRCTLSLRARNLALVPVAGQQHTTLMAPVIVTRITT